MFLSADDWRGAKSMETVCVKSKFIFSVTQWLKYIYHRISRNRFIGGFVLLVFGHDERKIVRVPRVSYDNQQ